MVIKNKHVSGDIKNHHLQSTKVSRFLIFKKSLLTNMILLSFIVANLRKIKKKTKNFLIFFLLLFLFLCHSFLHHVSPVILGCVCIFRLFSVKSPASLRFSSLVDNIICLHLFFFQQQLRNFQLFWQIKYFNFLIDQTFNIHETIFLNFRHETDSSPFFSCTSRTPIRCTYSSAKEGISKLIT